LICVQQQSADVGADINFTSAMLARCLINLLGMIL
jgi:hypothetical protein